MIKEMRFRKKKTSSKSETQAELDIKKFHPDATNRSEKLAVLVLKGSVVVGAVFHINSVDNTGEFDPFYIERIKNCIQLMLDKEFIAQLDHEIQVQHTLKNKEIAVKYEEMMVDQANAKDEPENFDQVNLDDRLMTYRGPKGAEAREQQFMRSIRKPDFLRTSLMSTRKVNPRAKSTKTAELAKPKQQTAELVTDELTAAAAVLQKIAGKSVRPRRKSADFKEIKEAKEAQSDKKERIDHECLHIEPLLDPLTGVRMFHIASRNLYDAKIMSKNMIAGQEWFTRVMQEIYKHYAQLASSITSNLKRKIVKAAEVPQDFGEKSAFTDVCEYLANDFFFGVPQHYVDERNTIQAARYLQRTGGRINKVDFESGITVWEAGTLLEIPFPAIDGKRTLHSLWIVAKVLQENTKQEEALNLGNTSSESEEETNETYELKENFGFEEILPEG